MNTPTWVGRRLAGRYSLEERLWQRESAAAYRGRDQAGRQVSLTLLSAGAAGLDSFRARFEREARAVSQLRHPNIAPLLDFGLEGEVAYLVHEHFPGGMLSDRLRGQPLALPEAARIASAVGAALNYAHSRGMTHRTLSSVCVLFDGRDQPLLAQFGLAAIVGDDGQAGDVHYLSPEQVRGQAGDERSDVYSLGVVAFEMATGRLPFPGTAPLTVMLSQLNDPPPEPRSINPALPETWSRALLSALAKDPHARYHSASNLTMALVAPAPSTAVSARTRLEPRPPAQAEGTILEQFSLPPQNTVVEPRLPAARPAPPPANPPPVITPPPVFTPPPHLAETPPPVMASWAPGAALPQPPPAPARRFPTLLFAGVAGVVLVGLVVVVAIGLAVLRGGGASPTEAPPEATTSADTSSSLPSGEGMVQVAAGTYPLGVDKNDANYATARTVELQAFWLDQFEVTNAEYAAYVESGGSVAPYGWDDGHYPAGEDNHPVRGVTFDQAAAYCQALGKRLPQEAEWEAAARGPQGSLYPWGDDPNTVQFDPTNTYPVGSVPANKSWAGAYDMAGNAWEWVSSPYEPVPGGQQVLRGGSFNFPQDMAYRLVVSQTVLTAIVDAGFRCAASEVK
jgi:formylglycine-generating enzyme required for sulfatase activity